MVIDAADGVLAAHIQTGIATLLTDAGVQAGAIRADQALWPAVWWRADVVRPAGAARSSAYVAAVSVGTARRRPAGVLRRDRRDGHCAAARPWVAAEAHQTVTDWVVVVDPTLGVLAAHAWARVNALVARACLILCAFRVAGALWLALDVWVATVRLQAGADGHGTTLRALSVDTARRWEAWLDNHRSRRSGRCGGHEIKLLD